MKKISVIMLIALALLAGCKRQQQTQTQTQPQQRAAGETFDLALITDLGTIDDKSFNQGAWEGLSQYARENNISHKYYQPSEQSDDAYLSAIDLAVRGGAKVIVTPGFLFEAPIFTAQDRYPDVYFVLVDGVPHDPSYTTFRTGPKTVGILYAEDQAGFLAGYAAVKDGNRSLGFVGGMAVPAVVRFGYGFIQGAEYAAKELKLAAGSVTVNYHYTGAFAASPEAQTLAASWYNRGMDVIFACGGAVGNSVMAAAEQAGKKVIGVDVDQSGESSTVITSATKGLQVSVFNCIDDYYNNRFPGGQTKVFEAVNRGVGLPMVNSKFQTFSLADYNTIFRELSSGIIPRMMDDPNAGGSPSVVPVSIVKVTEVK
ncbi:MAG: BMP family ABC transporter substrate-binding protein [Treponema sp.]|jgi:basic membrane protein A|nr:BMP family ABC transporter substrate-binding protein [Treponema sp.]